jgi:hypothetical protein
MPGLELPLVLIAILAGTLAVTSASRGAWVAIALLALTSSALEFSVADSNRIGLILRLSAIGIGLVAALPENLFEREALRRDLALSTLCAPCVTTLLSSPAQSPASFLVSSHSLSPLNRVAMRSVPPASRSSLSAYRRSLQVASLKRPRAQPL